MATRSPSGAIVGTTLFPCIRAPYACRAAPRCRTASPVELIRRAIIPADNPYETITLYEQADTGCTGRRKDTTLTAIPAGRRARARVGRDEHIIGRRYKYAIRYNDRRATRRATTDNIPCADKRRGRCLSAGVRGLLRDSPQNLINPRVLVAEIGAERGRRGGERDDGAATSFPQEP